MTIFNLSTKIQTLAFSAVVLALAACGGSSSNEISDTIANSPSGESSSEKSAPLFLALTDAEGDFLTYVVDITSIALTRSNGADLEVLPITTSVDFAQYVEVSELLTMADVPTGRYTGAAITLDYSSAQVTVPSESGEALAANVVDDAGNTLSTVTVEVELEDKDSFIMRPGVPSQVTLDFDLSASNEVSIVDGTATVTVNPVFLADTVLAEQKDMRLRGLLADVDIDANTFDIALRPFYSRSRKHQGFGQVAVHVNEETTFEIDGEEVDNSSGLTALSNLGEDAALVTQGIWHIEDKQYVAHQIIAGNSVPWNEADIIRGTVVSRLANELTVRGAVIELADGAVSFDDEVTVSVSENTVVVAAQENRHRHYSDSVEITLADISVGSNVVINGEYNDAANIDASQGQVRVLKSSISGSVVNISPLAIELSLVNGRQLALFDFSGTGTSVDSDADPLFYDIDSNGLPGGSLELGDPVRVLGFVTQFGTAPEDFSATTIINSAAVKAHLKLCWDPDSSELAIAEISEDGIRFNASESRIHSQRRAGFTTNLQALNEMPLVVPGEAEAGSFAVTRDRETVVYNDFSSYVAAVSESLAAGESLVSFYGEGYHDAITNSFRSQKMRIKLVAASEGSAGNTE